MINQIELKSFKCFVSDVFNLSPLTVLTGLNGGGKTTLIQSILLLQQFLSRGLQQSAEKEGLDLNGPHLALGTVGDVQNQFERDGGVGISIANQDARISWAFGGPALNREDLVLPLREISWLVPGEPEGRLESPTARMLPPALAANERLIRFIHAISTVGHVPSDRVGPQDVYPRSRADNNYDLGPRAERAFAIIEGAGGIDFTTEHLQYPDPSVPLKLRHQILAWFAWLFPDAKIVTTALARTNIMTVGIRTTDDREFYRPQHVGFGITYVLPVLVSILSAKPGQTVIVENPEAYLHPRAQGKIGRLCATAARAGIQVIVETHSDHVLNGIRLVIHNGDLPPGDAAVLFFDSLVSGDIRAKWRHIGVERNGRLTEWPEGFFDESSRLLSQLVKPAPQR